MLYDLSMAKREEIISNNRALTLENAEELAKLGVSETKMGRVEDKALKHRLVAQKTPGTEILVPSALSGDYGLTLTEHAPYGVIAAVTPSTNPSETIICNTIGMIASGNAVVFNPHPQAARTSHFAVNLVNRAAREAGIPYNIAYATEKPTVDSFNMMISSPHVKLICCTGGPGVVKAVLSSGKKAIAAGAGNPPVIIDESADLEKAARDVASGASFDNNLPCIAEKEVFAAASIYDDFLPLMQRHGACLISHSDMKRLEQLVLAAGKNGKPTLNRDWVGRDAHKYLEALGLPADPNTRLIICEAEFGDAFVQEELMMPILPIVKAKDADEAIELAVKAEHGYRHSAHMHAKNIDHLTRFARAVQTTIFVKNAPSYAGIGVNGEGHCTFTIAGPTGEGLTNALSFTRSRRCVMADSLHIA
jgi:propionaldehyde dehydrogenase